jgi:hypothetical protein
MFDVRQRDAGLRIAGTLLSLLFASALPLFAMVLIAEPGGPDQELYNQGRSLIFEESWTKARGVFESLARRYPDSTYLDDALYWTAFSLYEEGKPEMGYQTLRSLVSRYPDSPWNEDARALMVRCAEAALKLKGSEDGARSARAGNATEYRRFLEESTRDRSAQVSLLAIDTLLHQDPQKAPDLLGRVDAAGSGQEGAVVLLDRFFGKDLVKVTFDAISAGFSEGNVHVLVRDGVQAIKLTLSEALDLATGKGDKRFSDLVRREMREKILEAERSIVTQGPSREVEGFHPGKRTATIVRVIDGEVHYYTNGAETVRLVVLRRSAGFTPDNVQVYVDGAGGMKHVLLADAMSGEPGPTARGLSPDALHYLSQSLGVIQLDLSNASR